MEELSDVCGHMKLTDEENTSIVLDPMKLEVTRKDELWLVGKLCLERNINKKVFSSTMVKLWKEGKLFTFQEIRLNLFIIQFASEVDKQQVLGRKPWLFDNYLFMFQMFDGLVLPHFMSFDFETF